MKNNIVVYPGSFDPITKGHYDIIKRASSIFPKREIQVIVADNRDKKHMFSGEERFEIVQKTLVKLKNVKVILYDGILSDYLIENKVPVMIRGIRNSIDFEYESNLEQFTRDTSKTETVYLSPLIKHSNTSSSLVRNFIQFSNIEKIKKYVLNETYEEIIKIINSKKDIK